MVSGGWPRSGSARPGSPSAPQAPDSSRPAAAGRAQGGSNGADGPGGWTCALALGVAALGALLAERKTVRRRLQRPPLQPVQVLPGAPGAGCPPRSWPGAGRGGGPQAGRRRASGRAAGGGNHGAATHPRSSPVPIAAAAPGGRRGPSLALEFWVLVWEGLFGPTSRGRPDRRGAAPGRPRGGWARGRARRGSQKMNIPGTPPPFPDLACGRRRPASKPKEEGPNT